MARTTAGFSVRIFIPSGEPAGLRIVEKSNWTLQGLVFPRSLVPEARQRPDLKRTGVYVLRGPSQSGQLPRVYVGEGDGVLSRLDQLNPGRPARTKRRGLSGQVPGHRVRILGLTWRRSHRRPHRHPHRHPHQQPHQQPHVQQPPD